MKARVGLGMLLVLLGPAAAFAHAAARRIAVEAALAAGL